MNKETKSFRVQKIVVQLFGGASLDTAMKEACVLALQEGVVVEFDHNSRVFRIDPQGLLDFAEKAFHVK